MKTPREILLARHRAVDPVLDRLRADVLATAVLPGDGRAEAASTSIYQVLNGWLVRAWTELFWSCRRAWAGVAAAWLVIVTLNLLSPEVSPVDRTQGAGGSRTIFTYLIEQERLLAELGDLTPVPAPAPPPAVPAPRSERRRHHLSLA